jgi:hypothetical protein
MGAGALRYLGIFRKAAREVGAKGSRLAVLSRTWRTGRVNLERTGRGANGPGLPTSRLGWGSGTGLRCSPARRARGVAEDWR